MQSKIIQLFQNAHNKTERVNLSKLKEYQNEVIHDGFGVKYVFSGEERYWLDNNLVKLKAGQCLLVNHGQELRYDLQSKNDFHVGLCLYFSQSDVSNFAASLKVPFTLELNREGDQLEIPQIVIAQNHLHRQLSKLCLKGEEAFLNLNDWEEFKFELLQVLFESPFHCYAWKELNNSDRAYRDELIRRLEVAKEALELCCKLALIAICNKLLKQAFAIAKSGLMYDENYKSSLVVKS